MLSRKCNFDWAGYERAGGGRPPGNAGDAVIRKALRVLEGRMRSHDPLLTSPQAVRDYLRLRIASLEHEVFVCLFLDAQHRMIAAEELFRGTLSQTSVYPREVVKAALPHNAATPLRSRRRTTAIA